MPVAQAITATLEQLLNQLLKLDPDSHIGLKKLSGKSLQVRIKELPWPLLFSFSERVDIRTLDSTLAADHAMADCLIELDLHSLPKLQDSSQLTQLIQQQQLTLVGDIYVAQTFSALIKELHIDWEEQLSQYTGDVLAHQTFSTMRTLFDDAQNAMKQGSTQLFAHLSQADSVTITGTEMNQFSDQVNDLRSDLDRLSARIELLIISSKDQPEEQQS
jgi:ubiquinone biosynthesis protein UbiJ